MRQFSPSLQRLLIIKGLCRFGPVIYILWSIFDWLRTDWRYAAGFAALTLNYVIVLALTWTAPRLMNAGPWRIRPWQTFVLAANAIVLPIKFHRVHGHLPWIFFLATFICVASLYIGSAIHLYLHEKLPSGDLFAAGKAADPAPIPQESASNHE